MFAVGVHVVWSFCKKSCLCVMYMYSINQLFPPTIQTPPPPLTALNIHITPHYRHYFNSNDLCCVVRTSCSALGRGRSLAPRCQRKPQRTLNLALRAKMTTHDQWSARFGGAARAAAFTRNGQAGRDAGRAFGGHSSGWHPHAKETLKIKLKPRLESLGIAMVQ